MMLKSTQPKYIDLDKLGVREVVRSVTERVPTMKTDRGFIYDMKTVNKTVEVQGSLLNAGEIEKLKSMDPDWVFIGKGGMDYTCVVEGRRFGAMKEDYDAVYSKPEKTSGTKGLDASKRSGKKTGGDADDGDAA